MIDEFFACARALGAQFGDDVTAANKQPLPSPVAAALGISTLARLATIGDGMRAAHEHSPIDAHAPRAVLLAAPPPTFQRGVSRTVAAPVYPGAAATLARVALPPTARMSAGKARK
jgi:hypothetical protein